MHAKILLLFAGAALVAAAAPTPATLEPSVTGSMYNGNNVHPPVLTDAATPPQGSGSSKAETAGQGATGANIQGGSGAARGGGG